MPTQQEKNAFAQRLRIALDQWASQRLTKTSSKAIKGGAELARQFNLKHAGESGISAQAAHKWLTGHAIPTADKMKTLAEWLGVTEHWLNYGPPPEEKARDIKKPPSLEMLKLAEKIQALPAYQQSLIAEIVTQFSKNLI